MEKQAEEYDNASLLQTLGEAFDLIDLSKHKLSLSSLIFPRNNSFPLKYLDKEWY